MFLGYIYPKDNRLYLTVILCFLQFSNLLFSGDDLQAQTLNAYFAALDLNCCVRTYNTNTRNTVKTYKFAVPSFPHAVLQGKVREVFE